MVLAYYNYVVGCYYYLVVLVVPLLDCHQGFAFLPT